MADSVLMRAHVLAKIRALNRVLCVWETMCAALDSLAVVTPEWLRSHSQPEWVERYGPARKSRVCLWGKKHVWLLPKKLDSKEERCWMPSLIQPHLTGSVRFQQETFCAGSGSKIINASNRWFSGVLLICTLSIRDQRRTVTIRPQEQYVALKERCEREKTKEFQQVSAKRSGIEGTGNGISEKDMID